PAAVGIALMSFVETVAAGRPFRGEDEPRSPPNRELLALGLTNLVGGFFQNMPSGGGRSQTVVNRGAGARTQLAALVTAATVAAVVVVPCAGMIKMKEFRAVARMRPMEFSWALAAVAGVVMLGTLKGILV